MKNKKLITVFTLISLAINLGIATVFAQAPGGTQEIGCPATDLGLYSWDPAPTNFNFPNATSPSEYQTTTGTGINAGPTASTLADSLTISSAISSDCVNTPPRIADYGVAVTVTPVSTGWLDGATQLRSTLGFQEYSILSLNHSQAALNIGEAGTLTTLQRSTAYICAYLSSTIGIENAACNEGGNTYTNLELIEAAAGTLPTVNALTILESADGFSGPASIETIRYYHALPKSAPQGTFTTTLNFDIISA